MIPKTTPPLRIERPEDRLAILTLDRPEAMNALSMALRQDIVSAFRQLAEEGVEVVILTGAGRAFCAGLDLVELGRDSSALASVAKDDPTAAVRDFPGVVIGAINGAAVTGGFELALACDLLIASEAARFSDSHARVGVLPGWQLSQKLSRTIGLYRAKQVSLAGRKIDARLAEAWGLVSEVVEGIELMARARDIATDMLSAPPSVLRALKSVIDDGYARDLTEGLALEAQRSADYNATVAPDAIAERRAVVQNHGRGA